ncbi:MAG: flavin reductase family protein [Gammaproteobacteria bacterium]
MSTAPVASRRGNLLDGFRRPGYDQAYVKKPMSAIAHLFRQLTHSVYVVGVAHGSECNAFTAAWVMQASFDPLLLALAINPRNASYPLLIASGAFTVSVLRQDQITLAAHFARPRCENKLAGFDWSPKRTGAPVLAECLAYFECLVASRCAAGDHELVLGRVVDGGLLKGGAPPLHYCDTGDLDGSGRLFPEAFKVVRRST